VRGQKRKVEETAAAMTAPQEREKMDPAQPLWKKRTGKNTLALHPAKTEAMRFLGRETTASLREENS